MATLIPTVRESLRYRGRSGHWSWLAHRVSGLGILFYLVIHVWDTANAFFYPALYHYSIDLFKHPLFGAGEIALMAAVLYHAFNGIRITLLDFKPEWWIHQRTSTIVTWALFLIIFIPVGIFMFVGIVNHCADLAAEGASCWTLPSLSNYVQ